MRSKYEKIEISKINLADTSFQLSESGASTDLLNSIASLGLLNPPALLQRADGYCIVSGFARVDACRKLGYSEIISRVIAPNTPLKKCVQLTVADKAFQKSLDTVEQARAIYLIEQVCESVEEVIAVAQHLGLSLNHKMVEKLKIVNQMPDCLKLGLASGAIALPVALQIQNIKERDVLGELCQLFVELNLSLNRQRAMLEWLFAISKREQIGIQQLLAEKPLQEIRQSKSMDRRHKEIQIRHYLKKRRLPTISSFESKYSEMIKKLRLKKGARVVAPANLEGSTYSIQIDFQNLDEMKAMEKEVRRIIQSPHMARILDQLKSKG